MGQFERLLQGPSFMITKQHACCKAIAGTIAANDFILRNIHRRLFNHFPIAGGCHGTLWEVDCHE